jgi:hypothetical protein
MQMSTKQVFLALALVTVLGLAAPRAQAQIVGGGGYVGFGTPGFGGAVSFGTPVGGVGVVAAPVVPYVAPYPVVVPRAYGVPYYGAGWGGYGPRYYAPRYYRGGYGYRRW